VGLEWRRRLGSVQTCRREPHKVRAKRGPLSISSWSANVFFFLISTHSKKKKIKEKSHLKAFNPEYTQTGQTKAPRYDIYLVFSI